jgi:hypothetical protein
MHLRDVSVCTFHQSRLTSDDFLTFESIVTQKSPDYRLYPLIEHGIRGHHERGREREQFFATGLIDRLQHQKSYDRNDYKNLKGELHAPARRVSKQTRNAMMASITTIEQKGKVITMLSKSPSPAPMPEKHRRTRPKLK